ncbi:MAG: right-handed parallel beta-helix repeat-containing protein [Myxococcota bacterium]
MGSCARGVYVGRRRCRSISGDGRRLRRRGDHHDLRVGRRRRAFRRGASAGGGGQDGEPPETFYDPNGTIIYADQPTMPQIAAAQPGDVLLFEPGEHDRIDLDDITSSACDPLVLVSLDPDDPALIGNTTNPGWDTIGIERSSYVVVENLIVEGGITGIRVEGSDHVIVLRNEIRESNHSGFNVRDRSQYVDFIGNLIHHTGRSEPMSAVESIDLTDANDA